MSGSWVVSLLPKKPSSFRTTTAISKVVFVLVIITIVSEKMPKALEAGRRGPLGVLRTEVFKHVITGSC